MDRATSTPGPAAPARVRRGPARKRLSPEERRAQILRGAVGFFSEVGLGGTTRELAQRLGVTQSLIFNYYPTKGDLLEAVYREVYLERLSPEWPLLIRDRTLPLRTRMVRFYHAYTEAIFTYEWMRIFMFSGLAGEALNRRYLQHLTELILAPMLDEIRAEAEGPDLPVMEDLWALHGGIIYIGIRRFVYQVPTPEDATAAVERSIDVFLGRRLGVDATDHPTRSGGIAPDTEEASAPTGRTVRSAHGMRDH
ncbi:MAG: TetR/AcrR family transcriptional regulator [Alkalilacustris sp.]